MRYAYKITLTGSIEAATVLEANQTLTEQLEGKLPEADDLGTPFIRMLPDGSTETESDLSVTVELKPMYKEVSHEDGCPEKPN